jgi:FSR family fosmidomycin resistance protein-like MFS transporter
VFLLIEFFDELHYAVGGAVLPALRDELSFTYAQAGLLLGLPAILGTLVEPFLMLLGDTRLRKPLILGGGFAIFLSLLLTAATHSFLLLLLAFIISFPASGAFVTLSQATLMDQNRGRETHMMARWTVAGSFGNLLGPLLLAGALSISLGWRPVYFALAAFVLALTLFLLPFPFPSRVSIAGNADSPRQLVLSLHRNLQSAFKNRKLLRWVALLELSDLLLDVFTGYAALYFTDVVGVTAAQASLYMSLLMLASLLADLLAIPLLERAPGRRVVGWYPVLQGEAYATMPDRSGTVMAITSLGGIAAGALTWFIGWFAGQAGLAAAMWLLLLGPVSLALFVPAPEKSSLSPTA